jgi:hypothetical protein
MNDHRYELSMDLCLTPQLLQELAVLQMAVCYPHLSPRKAIVDINQFCFIFFQIYEKFLGFSPVSDFRKIPS